MLNSIKALNFDKTRAQWNDNKMPEIGYPLTQIKNDNFQSFKDVPNLGGKRIIVITTNGVFKKADSINKGEIATG